MIVLASSNHSLGQGCSLHSLVWLNSPSHGSPPWNGPMHDLLLLWCPPPHDKEHCSHSDQSSNTPFTEIIFKPLSQILNNILDIRLVYLNKSVSNLIL